MDNKMKKELEEFRKFKKEFKFEQKQIVFDGQQYYCDNELLEDALGNIISESDKWINAGYNLKNPMSKALSNLFYYEFIFKEKKLNSIESFFQGVKIKDKNTQDYVFNYSGILSNYIKIASDYDWTENKIIYWQGVPIKRDSDEYNDLIDELYVSAIQNPLYRNVLSKVSKPIIHSVGKDDKKDTLFTRYEFEYMLNCLVAFLKNKI